MEGETQNFVFLVIGFRGCALEADDGLGVGFSVGPLATPSAIFTQLKKTSNQGSRSEERKLSMEDTDAFAATGPERKQVTVISF